MCYNWYYVQMSSNQSKKVRQQLLDGEPVNIESQYEKGSKVYNIELLVAKERYWKASALAVTEFLE